MFAIKMLLDLVGRLIMKEIQGQSFLQNHPCYNKAASANWGRLHLPVAPNCNIQCNYCNRKYDCANENRPGVTQYATRGSCLCAQGV